MSDEPSNHKTRVDNGSADASKESRSVLKILDQTIDVPRVILQDTDLQHPDLDRMEPLENPRSPELPERDPDSRYTLQGEIARGGMGAIIKGRDVDLGRDLAIKVLLDEHKSKPQIIERFIEEAQIGGQLQHPGIAPVYELGQFSDQRPYFSMKLVKGTTLSKLLAKRSDATEDRARFLGIFEQICQTVGYAHARGVIHRDLKPANIMVGAFGEVQVMDWGLAKVLPNGGVEDEKAAQSRHKQQTVLRTVRSSGSDLPEGEGLGSGSGSGSADTQMGSIMGTPAYMSPEQAQGIIELVDQRSDVFGLGAILCEILTGLPPYVDSNPNVVFRMATKGKLDDALKRLDDCGAGDELIGLTKQCLSVESVDRPRDASALTERITCYLESVETKLRKSEVERASEAARVVEQRKRVRVTTALAASILLVLGLGIAGTSWYAFSAEQARKEAVQLVVSEQEAKQAAEASRAQAEKSRASAQAGVEVLASIFADLDPEEIANKDRPLQNIIAEQLDSAVAKLQDGSVGEPLVVADLEVKLAKSLLALDQAKKALPLLENARQTLEELKGISDAATLECMHFLGNAYSADAQLEKVMPLRQITYDLRKEHLGEKHEDTLQSLVAMSAAYSSEGDYAKATELAEEAAAGLEKVLGPVHRITLDAKQRLLDAYTDDGQWNKMLDQSESMYESTSAEFGVNHTRTLWAGAWVAFSKSSVIGPEEGVRALESFIDRVTKTLGPDHSTVLESQELLSRLYSQTQQWDRAIETAKEVLTRREVKLGLDHPKVIRSLNALANAFQRNRMTDKVLLLNKRILDWGLRNRGVDHPDTNVFKANYGLGLIESGKYEDAVPILKECVNWSEEQLGSNHPTTLVLQSNLAVCYKGLGALDKAIQVFSLGLKRNELEFGVTNSRTSDFVGSLCVSYRLDDQGDKALELAKKYLDRCEEELGRQNLRTQVYLSILASLYRELGKTEQAVPIFEELFQTASSDYLRRVYGNNLIEVYGLIGDKEKIRSTFDVIMAEMRDTLEPDSIQLANALASLVVRLLKAGAYLESEIAGRDCLKIREREVEPQPYKLSVARFQLGRALLGQRNLSEAESLLNSGYRGLVDSTIAAETHSNDYQLNFARDIVQNGLADIVGLYRSFGKLEKANKLEAELNDRMKVWGREPITAGD